MLDALDALHAHAQCRAHLVLNLKRRPACLEYADVAQNAECPLVRFVEECATRHGDWPEIDLLRSAHKHLHALAMEMARRVIAGERIDVDAENDINGRIADASAAVTAAIWRLERRLHSVVG